MSPRANKTLEVDVFDNNLNEVYEEMIFTSGSKVIRSMNRGRL